MFRSIHIAGAAAALALAGSAAEAATTYKIDVTVRSLGGNAFSAPIFTFANLSDAGVQVNGVSVAGGPPWDYVLALAAPYDIANPVGGSRTITSGTEAGFDENNGGPTTISYALTGFDPGEFFRFALDPEGPGGGSAVVDIRPWLTGDLLGVSASFAGGPTLSGSDWTQAFDAGSDDNQVYRLTLQQTVTAVSGVPEPATWAMMILGFGGVGAALRSRRRLAVA